MYLDLWVSLYPSTMRSGGVDAVYAWTACWSIPALDTEVQKVKAVSHDAEASRSI